MQQARMASYLCPITFRFPPLAPPDRTSSCTCTCMHYLISSGDAPPFVIWSFFPHCPRAFSKTLYDKPPVTPQKKRREHLQFAETISKKKYKNPRSVLAYISRRIRGKKLQEQEGSPQSPHHASAPSAQTKHETDKGRWENEEESRRIPKISPPPRLSLRHRTVHPSGREGGGEVLAKGASLPGNRIKPPPASLQQVSKAKTVTFSSSCSPDSGFKLL